MENKFGLENIIGEYSFIIYIIIIFLIAWVINFIISFVYKRVSSKFEKNNKVWKFSIVSNIYRPLCVFIWFIALTVAVQVSISSESAISSLINPFRTTFVVLLFVWFLINFIKDLEGNLSKTKFGHVSLDTTTLKALSHLLRILVIISAGLILLQTFNIPISGVIAFGGVGGLAAGFAAKDLLANFFGGFFIFLDRPFKIGDTIRSPDKEIEGVVEHIGWRLTRIRTLETRSLYVPNSLFLTVAIENQTRMTNRRIKTIIGLSYKDLSKIGSLMEQIESMLKNHPEIDKSTKLFVHLSELAPSSLNFLIYCYTKTTDFTRYHAVQQDVLLKVMDIIEKNGAECAFPTTTLHIPQSIGIKQS